ACLPLDLHSFPTRRSSDLGNPFGEEVVARTRHRCPKMPGCRGLGKVPVGVTACPFSPYFWVEKPRNSTPGTVRPPRVLHRGGHITQAHDPGRGSGGHSRKRSRLLRAFQSRIRWG